MDFSEIGVTSYYYDLPPALGKLRKEAEDFYVEEKFDRLERIDQGKVLVLKLKSKSWEHNRLIRFIARANGVSPRRVYFSGTKDRRSVKVQYFSIPGIQFKEFSLKDVDIMDHFYVDSPLKIGSHAENFFKIRISDCNPDPFVSNSQKVAEKGIFPNFYGPQRFGALRPVTHLVGREIVKGNYKEAVRVFVGYPGEDRFKEIRMEFYKTPDPSKFYDLYPEPLDLEKKVMKHLVYHEEDYVGAIKQLPENLVSMFIHAYQGFIFNKILSKRLEIKEDVIVGDIYNSGNELVKINALNLNKFATMFNRHEGSPTGLVAGYDVDISRGKMGDIESAELSTENVESIQFKLPFGLKSRGERRDIFSRAKDIKFEYPEIEFSLPPGSYATSLLREIIRVDKMENY